MEIIWRVFVAVISDAGMCDHDFFLKWRANWKHALKK